MKRIPYDISPTPEYIDDHIEMAHQLLIDLDGGTEEAGESLASKILFKIENDEPLTHSLIIFGETYYEDYKNKNIRAENTPFNNALIRTFSPNSKPSEIVGGREVKIGQTGLTAVMECVWDPEDDLSDEEKNGLKRHLKGDIINDSDPSHAYAGVLILPKVALRASIKE